MTADFFRLDVHEAGDIYSRVEVDKLIKRAVHSTVDVHQYYGLLWVCIQGSEGDRGFTHRFIVPRPRALHGKEMMGMALGTQRRREGLGKFASAWTRFKDVASESRAQGQTARADHATARARALEPKLSYLSVDVPEDSRLPGLVVRRSGVEVGRAAWGTAMPVDPGEVELSASAPGYLEWKTRVKPRAGSVPLRVSIPRLLAESDGHIGAAPAATGSAPDRATPARAPAATRSPLPWVLIGVGGAGILVGGVAGALALDEKSTLEDGCKDKKCPPELHDDVDAFDRWRTVSSVGFVVGAVSVASGITWLLLDDGKKSVQVGADFGPGFARVRGRF